MAPRTAPIIALALLAGCARAPVPVQPTPEGAPTLACVPHTSQNAAPRRVSDREIDVRVGARTWRSILPDACPALANMRPLDIFVFDVRGSQLCFNDRFRVVDPQAVRTVGLQAFPLCRLGRFVELPPRTRD